CIQGLEFPFTF
nr:immunoglobulin light chain junction region [Macaca mulatta]MOW39806.1 immunoglobulin light chain junction region [Macaca mulatta]